MLSLSDLVARGKLEYTGQNARGFDEYIRPNGERTVLVPAGSFVMGTSESEAREVERRVPWYKASMAECPEWQPWLDNFLIDLYEVTCRRFADFLNRVSCTVGWDERTRKNTLAVSPGGLILACDALDFIEQRGIEGSQHAVGVHWNGRNWEPISDTEHCPVVLVTWFGAAAYASWVGFELPTEAQWEKAARGTDGRRFPWGNEYDPKNANTAERWLGQEIPDQATWDKFFYREGKGKAWLASRPLPVGTSSESLSPYGCKDMVGNVAEWCSNWYHEDAYLHYQSEGQDFGLKVPESGFRCMRGAGRYGYEAISRCSCRRRRDPASVSENLGFRCALGVHV